MPSNTYILSANGELYHWGIKGMKWGVRRYQNKDGSLTNAGKRRLAKSIKKAAKDTSYAARSQLRKDIAEDLSTSYKTQMRKHIDNIKTKKKIYDELDKVENDYWDSGAADKDTAVAYKDTIDWFKKHDKTYLDEIVKLNGGKTANLDMYHDFRKTFEGYQDLAWQKGEKKFYKDKGIDPNAVYKARDDYVKACSDAANDILGEYGRTIITSQWIGQTNNTVQNLVSEALQYNIKDFD